MIKIKLMYFLFGALIATPVIFVLSLGLRATGGVCQDSWQDFELIDF